MYSSELNTYKNIMLTKENIRMASFKDYSFAGVR